MPSIRSSEGNPSTRRRGPIVNPWPLLLWRFIEGVWAKKKFRTDISHFQERNQWNWAFSPDKNHSMWLRHVRLIRITGITTITLAVIYLAYISLYRPISFVPPVIPSEGGVPPLLSDPVYDNSVPEIPTVKKEAGFVSPLGRGDERVTKKPFGLLIHMATSPIQPERFSGYHTGTDFEIFPEESDIDVIVSAVCTGPLLSKRSVNGYGGVAVQSCEYEGKPVTIIYGHLQLAGIKPKRGMTLSAGEFIGMLGNGYSVETDGERKHLHLGIHKGATPDIRGYVSDEHDLSRWIDPISLIFGSFQ